MKQFHQNSKGAQFNPNNAAELRLSWLALITVASSTPAPGQRQGALPPKAGTETSGVIARRGVRLYSNF